MNEMSVYIVELGSRIEGVFASFESAVMSIPNNSTKKMDKLDWSFSKDMIGYWQEVGYGGYSISQYIVH